MARFYGRIGYSFTEDKGNGVWETNIVEKNVRGEITALNRRVDTSNSVNADITLSSKVSIIADSFAMQNYSTILYVEYSGAKWRVTSVEPMPPRLILTTGGVYNG